MRSVIAVVSSVAMLVAQMPATPAFAQSAVSPAALQRVNLNADQAGPQSPVIAEAFQAFPKGGDPLSKRIADIIAKDPKLAVALVKFVQTAPGLSKDQKLAAERGLAEALNRLGIKAADMPVKAPHPVAEEVYDYTWLLALAAIAGLICLGVCHKHENQVPASPN
jgi:hypothetical protein